MTPEKIEGATRTLGKPTDWDEARLGPCDSLAVEDRDGCMISQWRPSAEEARRVAAGAPVLLSVVGYIHPAVSLYVGEAPKAEDSTLVKATIGITFTTLRAANLSRCVRWHPGGVQDWTPERWFTATALKKFFRVQDGIANINAAGRYIQSREQAIETIGDEIADTLIYLDLFAASLGIDLQAALRRVFNRTSEKYGFPERLGEHSAYLAHPDTAVQS